MLPPRSHQRCLRLACLLCLGLLFPGKNAGAAAISFTPSVSSIAPGESFTVDIYGASINEIGGFSLYLNAGSSDGAFQITSYTLNSALFDYGGPSPGFPQTISQATSSQDLGAFSHSALAANTPYFLGTATITASIGTPLAAYTFGSTALTVFANPAFTVGDFAPVSSFAVTVVPEPGEAGVLVAGMLAVCLLCRSAARGPASPGRSRKSRREADGFPSPP